MKRCKHARTADNPAATGAAGGGGGCSPEPKFSSAANRDKPPIRLASLGADDRLWLEREDDRAGPARWIILEPDGSPSGVLEVPRSLELLWHKDDIVWMVDEDELGVPWLVRYRILVRISNAPAIDSPRSASQPPAKLERGAGR